MSFLLSKGDQVWKEKRKATAHAFYKERMIHMLECLKDKISARCEKWASEAELNKEGKFATVDISKAFYDLFCENIVFILFDEDICSKFLVKMHTRQDLGGKKPTVLKSMNIGDALDELFE